MSAKQNISIKKNDWGQQKNRLSLVSRNQELFRPNQAKINILMINYNYIHVCMFNLKIN